MPLANYERETIINFNEAEDRAYVFTYNKSWQKHLEEKLGLKPVNANGFGGKDYELPRKMVKPPIAPRKLSAETRAKLSNLMRQKQDRTVKSQPKQVGVVSKVVRLFDFQIGSKENKEANKEIKESKNIST